MEVDEVGAVDNAVELYHVGLKPQHGPEYHLAKWHYQVRTLAMKSACLGERMPPKFPFKKPSAKVKRLQSNSRFTLDSMIWFL